MDTALDWLQEDYEIIVVDDGSSDNTRGCLLALASVMPTLRLISHHENLGQSAALLSGVRAARGEWVVTLDGDGQNDPRDIVRLLEMRETVADGDVPVLVIGARKKRHDSWLRRISSRIANAVRSGLLGDGCIDSGCGLKLFRRDAFLALPHFDHMHRFLPALFRRANGNVLSLEVNHRPRLAGHSKYGINNRLWVGIVDLFGVMWLNRRTCIAEGVSDSD
jgi:dolichol-phosphate mannosyltransferase